MDVTKMKDKDPARACYTGYILKALADIQNGLNDVRHWNMICPIMDEESKVTLERIYAAIEPLITKTYDKAMQQYDILIFPDDKIDWEQVWKDHKKLRGE